MCVNLAVREHRRRAAIFYFRTLDIRIPKARDQNFRR